jgi:hypothetical protein
VPIDRLWLVDRLRLDPPRTVQRVDAVLAHQRVGMSVDTEHADLQSLDLKYFDVERLSAISLDVKIFHVKEW